MLPEKGQDIESRESDIVVGVDGSPSALAALRWAMGQARLTGGRVRALTAWQLPFYTGWGPVIPYEDLAEAAGKCLSNAVQQVLDVDHQDVELLETIVPGNPAQALIDASAHAALLVVGCRGHGGFAGTLLGSVSQHCAQHAHCPVVIVRGNR